MPLPLACRTREDEEGNVDNSQLAANCRQMLSTALPGMNGPRKPWPVPSAVRAEASIAVLLRRVMSSTIWLRARSSNIEMNARRQTPIAEHQENGEVAARIERRRAVPRGARNCTAPTSEATHGKNRCGAASHGGSTSCFSLGKYSRTQNEEKNPGVFSKAKIHFLFLEGAASRLSSSSSSYIDLV